MRLILSYTHRWLLSALLACTAFLLLVSPVSAENVITNTMSVSADGGGESRAAVTTTINGETIEHWSATGTTTSYSHTIVVPNIADAKTNTSQDTPLTNSDTETQLKAIISQLLALITYYELLLTP